MKKPRKEDCHIHSKTETSIQFVLAWRYPDGIVRKHFYYSRGYTFYGSFLDLLNNGVLKDDLVSFRRVYQERHLRRGLVPISGKFCTVQP
jgi:hypothetical protein